MSTDPRDSTALKLPPAAAPKDDAASSNFEDSAARKKTIPKDHRLLPATDPKHSSPRKPPSTAGPKATTDRRLPSAMKIPDVASELSTSIGKIYEMVDLGKLHLIKLGPKTSRITGASVERVLAEHVQPDADIPNLKQYRKAPERISGN